MSEKYKLSNYSILVNFSFDTISNLGSILQGQNICAQDVIDILEIFEYIRNIWIYLKYLNIFKKYFDISEFLKLQSYSILVNVSFETISVPSFKVKIFSVLMQSPSTFKLKLNFNDDQCFSLSFDRKI